MAQYLSEDLRIRVIRAVEAGMSRNAAARRFGVSVASAVRWMDVYLRTGRAAPKPRGGDRRSGRIEAQADLLLRAIEEVPDITLAELRARLAGDAAKPLRSARSTTSTADAASRSRKDGACRRTGARGREGAPSGLARTAARP